MFRDKGRGDLRSSFPHCPDFTAQCQQECAPVCRAHSNAPLWLLLPNAKQNYTFLLDLSAIGRKGQSTDDLIRELSLYHFIYKSEDQILPLHTTATVGKCSVDTSSKKEFIQKYTKTQLCVQNDLV